MTETLSRGAANQAGARVDADAYAKAADFLPLDGIDHVEFWVGNARAFAGFLAAAFGFDIVAHAGPETGERDRQRWMLQQGDIRFLVTGALGPESPVAEHVRSHGDGVRDIAFLVTDVDAHARSVRGQGRMGGW